MRITKIHLILFPFCAFLMPDTALSQNIYDTLRTVKMIATPDIESTSITLKWEDDLGENTYSLYKKLRQETTWGNPISVTQGQDTSYLDSEIISGELYEYRMVKETDAHLGYAYLFSGLDYTPPQKKGDILLVVDNAALDIIEQNLFNYINILRSEGWRPLVLGTTADATVAEVKSLILEQYTSLDSLTSLILMGNIAVPHSGDINPDAHNDHKGAWPADLYYGDMDGVWTDEFVDNTTSAYPRIHNVPGDGNFDQDFIPSDIEIAVGRLDFSELPVFELNEYELLNNYLQKNIEYRTAVYRPKKRAVFKNKNPWTEGLGQNAIRNFVPLVTNDSLVYDDFFDAFYDSFLWSYGGSSGSMISSNSLGNINTYANNNFQATFTSYFGSYYGDYDFENNYLRTILASGKVLSTAWVGAPNWFFHPMGMGEDLGFCTKLTQNNLDLYYGGFFPQSVTINLLGDPTLKAFIVRPPQALIAVQNENNVELSWTASEDDILAYQVYKKTAAADYFAAINMEPIIETHFTDSCVIGGTQVQYLVKAIKREITPSGSFINHSAGPIISLQIQENVLPQADFNLTWENGILKTENLSTNATDYEWILSNGTSIFDANFEINYENNGELTVILNATNDCFSDSLVQTIDIINSNPKQPPIDVEIYPNPTKDKLTIKSDLAIQKLELLTTKGQSILSLSKLKAGSHTISLSQLIRGNYLLKITVNNQVRTELIHLTK